ncbi:PAS domain-containing protein [Ferrovibrio sp.]|uniref:PAS domain-containing protein n=1 Tax=Ferrovibrio sp. TaxID=1917215 RepID=UPI0025B81E46|nr:PAS domain-containing protein [Ferrovibrio sp.]MBX3455219.1 PAS domain-containing protein [Ferrovibrio sp.]
MSQQIEPHTVIPQLLRIADWPRMEDARLRLFMHHWAERRGDALVTLRSAIDPGQLKPCLPYLWIYRWLPQQDDFFCSLSGEAVNDAWGRSIRNRFLRDIMSTEDAGVLRQRYRHVMDTPAIHISRRPIQPHLQLGKDSERLILPLADDAGQVLGVFGMTLYHYDRVTEADKPIHPRREIEAYACADLPRGLPALD